MSPLLLALIAAGGGTVDPPPPTGWSLGEPGDPVWVPAGALDTWRAARDNAENELVEVIYFGDSTGYGQQPAGLTPAPPPFMLRGLALAGGRPDGGVGLYGASDDTTPPQGVDHAGIIAPVPVPARSIADSWDMLLTNVWQTNTTGASVTFQGKGTRCRLWATRIGGGIVPHYTYELDGGAPVEVVAPVDTSIRRVPTLITMSEGTHTVKVTNLGGDLRVIPDWVRTTGIVWHRASVPGQSSHWVGRDTGRILDDHLGLTPAGVEHTDRPRFRRARLAIFGLGINDQQQSITTSVLKANATTFITKARTAGADPLILVPHLEAANNNGNAPAYRQALYEVADENDAALCDIGSGGALGPSAGWNAAGYVSSMTDPHLYALGYQTQMAYLWDNLLKL